MTPQQQSEIELTNSLIVELSSKLLSAEIVLYSMLDLIIEKNIITKEEIESMIDDKKDIIENYIRTQKETISTNKISVMYYGTTGEA